MNFHIKLTDSEIREEMRKKIEQLRDESPVMHEMCQLLEKRIESLETTVNILSRVSEGAE